MCEFISAYSQDGEEKLLLLTREVHETFPGLTTKNETDKFIAMWLSGSKPFLMRAKISFEGNHPEAALEMLMFASYHNSDYYYNQN